MELHIQWTRTDQSQCAQLVKHFIINNDLWLTYFFQLNKHDIQKTRVKKQSKGMCSLSRALYWPITCSYMYRYLYILKEKCMYRQSQRYWPSYCSLQYMCYFTLSWPYRTSWTMASLRLSTVSGVWMVESGKETFQNKYNLNDYFRIQDTYFFFPLLFLFFKWYILYSMLSP